MKKSNLSNAERKAKWSHLKSAGKDWDRENGGPGSGPIKGEPRGPYGKQEDLESRYSGKLSDDEYKEITKGFKFAIGSDKAPYIEEIKPKIAYVFSKSKVDDIIKKGEGGSIPLPDGRNIFISKTTK